MAVLLCSLKTSRSLSLDQIGRKQQSAESSDKITIQASQEVKNRQKLCREGNLVNILHLLYYNWQQTYIIVATKKLCL